MTLQVIVKPFQPRTNLSKMFLFPWLDYGESITDFEKSTFFHHEVISGLPKGVLKSLSCIKSVDAGAHKNRKFTQKFKIMLESCKETSKLSVDSFMAS